MLYTYEYNGENYSIRLDKQPDDSFLATIGDETYAFNATQLKTGTWLIDLDGNRQTVHTASEQSNRYIQLDGVQYQLEKSSGRRRASSASGAAGDLKSEMPGQVIDVRVSEGDTVESGQVLLVLEAMKMEIRINAPYDGTVAKLLVSQGDVVDRGQLLVEVTEKEAP